MTFANSRCGAHEAVKRGVILEFCEIDRQRQRLRESNQKTSHKFFQIFIILFFQIIIIMP